MARERYQQQTWETASLADHIVLIRRQIKRSMADPAVRHLAVQIVSGVYDWMPDPRGGTSTPVIKFKNRYYRAPYGPLCEPKDDKCEIRAIWDFCVLNVRYVLDPEDEDGSDLYMDVTTILASGGGDCFPEGTLLLRDDYQLVPVEKIKAGDRIWGKDKWSVVERQWFKGVKPITAVRLNNGSWLKLTEDHKVYAIVDGKEERIHVSELKEGMELLQPERISFGKEEMDPEKAWVEGVFLADGWTDGKIYEEPCRFAISGRDGHPKEEQKKAVQKICERLGLNTRWHERYLAINDADWAQRMAQMGHHATQKHALSLNLQEQAARELLRGIMADSGKNSNGGSTFTTTSRELAIQTRILHRMCGISCGYSYIEEHGGLGKNPIHRLVPRLRPEQRPDGRASKRLLVKEIVREVSEGPVYDITTDDHYVYLPEHDVTVSNCDDFTIIFASLLKCLGYQVQARVISLDGRKWAHIYPMVLLPKLDPRKPPYPLDATENGKPMGWEYSRAKARQDFDL